MKKLLYKITPAKFQHLIQNPDFIKILKNINWLTIEKIFQLGLGIVVYAIIAQYLGPQRFGLLNYALAFTGLFLAFNTLGMDNIVVREIVHSKKKSKEILGSALVLRLLSSLLLIAISSLTIYFIRPDDSILLFFVVILSTGYIFRSFTTIDLWFQSQIQSKYPVYARSIAFVIVSSLKLLFVFTQQPLVAFVMMYTLEAIITAILLIWYYKYVTLDSILVWRPRFKRMRRLLQESWPLILSSIAVTLYMKIDQVMIGSMLNDEAVGIYSVAVKLSESWYFIPVAICSTVFPSIVSLKSKPDKYILNLKRLFSFAIWFSILVAVFVTIFANIIINTIYGTEYSLAAQVLAIHIWSGIFVFLGVASSNYLVAEGFTKISMLRTIIGAIVNIVLNIIFIPKYGVIAAAYTTLLSQAISTLSLILFTKTRKITIIMLRSFIIKS